MSESALERFHDLLESGSPSTLVDDAEFVDGEVIVFTDYYRVELT
ncbi:hypothetical protein ACFOZ7_14755 [Natribaculum luteum]|uniref:Uncharacterized protein n=1 Tax=Natribaculum luteum TaxID=1586232 RepID=A0ABD5P1Q2_9EURY|nr:hypothetical protein [Natribaculum luteum]